MKLDRFSTECENYLSESPVLNYLLDVLNSVVIFQSKKKKKKKTKNMDINIKHVHSVV